MANTYLTKNFGSAGTRTKYTISVWVKRSKLGATQCIFSAGTGANNSMTITFNGNDTLYWNSYSNNGSNYDYFLDTNRKFRDPSAWYHIVCAFDSTQSTSSNRMKIYINGVQETLFTTATYPGSYSDYAFNNIVHEIGQDVGAGSRFFDGSMSHFYGIDGTAYAASTFGSTDSTTGIWKINTSPSITMGTNGFTILKDGNTITDQSSNSNNFSLGGGAITKTQDCPDNNFATLNPLYVINAGQMPTLTNGGTTGTSTASGYSSGVASMAPSGSGKYYSEHKLKSGTGGWNTNTLVGYSPTPNLIPNAPHDSNFFYGVLADGGAKQGATSRSGYAGTWTAGDIIRLALDLDNNKLYVGKNQYWSDGSGNWDEANISGFLDLTASPAVAGDNWFVICGDKNTSTATWENNFGNGYFGTTAVSSSGTNASGNGIFEYNVPSGYSALSTKGLNL